MKNDENYQFHNFFPLIAGLIGILLLGVAPVFIRVIQLSPFVIGFYRFLFSIPFYAFWVAKSSQTIKLKTTSQDRFLLFMLGLFFSLNVSLWNQSVMYTQIANASLFNSISAFIVPVLSWLLFSIRPNIMFFIASLFAWFGVSFLTGGNLTLPNQLNYGDILSLMSALAFASYLVTLKILRKKYAVSFLLFWTGIIGSIILGLISLVTNQTFIPPSLSDFILLLSASILIQVVGQGLLAFAIKKTNPNFMALCILLAPIMATTLAWIMFSESMNISQIFGGGLILFGIAFSRIVEANRQQKLDINLS